MYRNLRLVPQLIYGRGSINQLGDILTKQRTDAGSPVVFLIDAVHEKRAFIQKLPLRANDLVILVDVGTEPKTQYVDELTERIKTPGSTSSCSMTSRRIPPASTLRPAPISPARTRSISSSASEAAAPWIWPSPSPSC